MVEYKEMKYFTIEEIYKALEKLLEHGWGDLTISVQNHKIYGYFYKESHKPEEEK